ncbi:MAG: hypothetical protein WC898_02455 [Candidatus Paceibacterota bacterium]|jgi:uncharacterized protein YmfQ (DUF2313 family)
MISVNALKKILCFVFDLFDDELKYMLDVIGGVFDDINDTIAFIKTQINPFEAIVDGSLPDFERFYQVYPATGDTLNTRRNNVVAAMRSRGGMNVSRFHLIAEGLGYIIGTTLIITEGSYQAFRADFSHADIDIIYDQDGIYSMYTVIVTGINVESDLILQKAFEKQRSPGINFIYDNL